MKQSYLLARSWFGFQPTFPFYDELTPSADGTLPDELEQRAIRELRSDRAGLKRRFRNELAALRAQKEPKPTRMARAVPRLPDAMDYCGRGVLELFTMDSLKQKASSLCVPIKGSKAQLLEAVVRAEEESSDRYLSMRHLMQSIETDRDGPFRKSYLKGLIRGDRADAVGCRIARLLGWTDSNVRAFGGVSPSRRLLLLRTDEEVADAIVKLLQEVLSRPAHAWLNVRLLSKPADSLSVSERASLAFHLDEVNAGKNGENLESRIHKWLAKEAAGALQVVEDVRTTGSGQSASDTLDATSAIAKLPRQTDQACTRTGRTRFPKRAQADLSRARDDTIAELIRKFARNGREITSEALSKHLTKPEGGGNRIPAGTIRASKSWKRKDEIIAEEVGDYPELEHYLSEDGDVIDGSARSPVEELMDREADSKT